MSDADELEREAEAARARLSETADQLKARMSPGQMMDEVLTQFRGGDGSQMLENLRTQARDNPMALALIGSGLAWLMMGSGPSAASRPQASSPAPRPQGSSAGLRPQGGFTAPGQDFSASRSQDFSSASDGGATYLRQSPTGSGEDGSSSGSGVVEGAADALASARQALGDRWEDAKESVGQVAQDLRSAGSDALGSLRQGAEATGRMGQDVRAAGQEKLAGLGHGAADLGHQARRTLADVLEREPLVIGALGLAVGAAIGALLPASEIERQHLGSTGEALRDKAGALLDRGVTAAKDAAAEVYETAKTEADRQGLTPGDQPLSEKVEAVVRAAGETASSIAERHVAAVDPEGETEGKTEGEPQGALQSGTEDQTQPEARDDAPTEPRDDTRRV